MCMHPFAQDLSSHLRGVLATQAVLEGMGVGRAGSTPLAATLQWMARDGETRFPRFFFFFFRRRRRRTKGWHGTATAVTWIGPFVLFVFFVFFVFFALFVLFTLFVFFALFVLFLSLPSVSVFFFFKTWVVTG